jgi:transcriptional regulator with GAF, ATPase, and Fis domain
MDPTFRLVVAWAAAALPGADSVSITLSRRGRLTTVASSDDAAVLLDDDQYATGQGPCVHAATEGEQVLIASTHHEIRWPRFVPHACDAGITGMLSTPLTVASEPVGALNLYGRGADGFGTDQQELAQLITAEAAAILTGEGDDPTAADRVRRLEDALRAREVIAQAQGILIHRDGSTAATAAAHLWRESRRADIPLRQLAADLVARTSGETDPSSRD